MYEVIFLWNFQRSILVWSYTTYEKHYSDKINDRMDYKLLNIDITLKYRLILNYKTILFEIMLISNTSCFKLYLYVGNTSNYTIRLFELVYFKYLEWCHCNTYYLCISLLFTYFILPISLSRVRNLSCYVDHMKFTFRHYIIMRYVCNVNAQAHVTFGNFPLKFQEPVIILFGRCIWNVITRYPW